MNHSIEKLKIVFWRLASSADAARGRRAGIGLAAGERFAALASTTFWFFQMTIHTLAAIVMPSSMPTMIAALCAERRTRRRRS